MVQRTPFAARDRAALALLMDPNAYRCRPKDLYARAGRCARHLLTTGSLTPFPCIAPTENDLSIACNLQTTNVLHVLQTFCFMVALPPESCIGDVQRGLVQSMICERHGKIFVQAVMDRSTLFQKMPTFTVADLIKLTGLSAAEVFQCGQLNFETIKAIQDDIAANEFSSNIDWFGSDSSSDISRLESVQHVHMDDERLDVPVNEESSQGPSPEGSLYEVTDASESDDDCSPISSNTTSPVPGQDRVGPSELLANVMHGRSTGSMRIPEAPSQMSHNPEIEETVRKLLMQGMKQKVGRVYVLHDPDSQHVKIGQTSGPVQNRVNEIRRNHGRPRTRPYWYIEESLPILQAEHLERWVHADLKDFRRTYHCPCKAGRQGAATRAKASAVHREWYDIPAEEAVRTIKLWLEFLRLEPFDQHGELKEPWRSKLRDGAPNRAYRHVDHDARHVRWTQLLFSDRMSTDKFRGAFRAYV